MQLLWETLFHFSRVFSAAFDLRHLDVPQPHGAGTGEPELEADRVAREGAELNVD